MGPFDTFLPAFCAYFQCMAAPMSREGRRLVSASERNCVLGHKVSTVRAKPAVLSSRQTCPDRVFFFLQEKRVPRNSTLNEIPAASGFKASNHLGFIKSITSSPHSFSLSLASSCASSRAGAERRHRHEQL